MKLAITLLLHGRRNTEEVDLPLCLLMFLLQVRMGTLAPGFRRRKVKKCCLSFCCLFHKQSYNHVLVQRKSKMNLVQFMWRKFGMLVRSQWAWEPVTQGQGGLWHRLQVFNHPLRLISWVTLISFLRLSKHPFPDLYGWC